MLRVSPLTLKPASQQIRLLKVAKRFCRKWRVDLLFATCTCCAFTDQGRRNSRVWRDYRVVLSNHKSVFPKLAATWFAARQVWFVGGKTRNISVLNSFKSNVSLQVTSFCWPFYLSLKSEIWHFHGVVNVQWWWQRKVQKSVLHMQSCCRAYSLTLLVFWRFCCRHRYSIL